MTAAGFDKLFGLYPAARSIGRHHHTQLIEALCTLVGARWIVELGTGPGFAMEAFLKSVERTSGHVWSIDQVARPGRAKWQDHARASFVIGDSIAFAAKHRGPVDVLYCDSDHSKAHVLAELNAWTADRPDIPLVLVDDVLDPNEPHGSPIEAVEAFCEEKGWDWWVAPIGTGLAILRPRDH